MNNLFIIGNGFDLAHGLETSYKHFILKYLNEVLQVARNSNGIYDDELIRIENDINYGSNEIIKSFDVFENKYNSNKYCKIKYKSQFVENIIKKQFERNWVDIEIEYYNELVRLAQIYKKSRSYDLITHNLKDLNNHFKVIKDNLINYLISINLSIQKSIFFENIFNDTVSKTGNNYKTLFLNFNYTDTINKYLESEVFENKRIEIINIHGQLKKNDNPIIFGYGDKIDNNYNLLNDLHDDFLENLKNHMYSNAENYLKLNDFLSIRENYNVYIIGHSCGTSDRILLNQIFDNPYCNKIELFYYKRSDNTDDFNERVRAINKHFKDIKSYKPEQLIIPKNISEIIPQIK